MDLTSAADFGRRRPDHMAKRMPLMRRNSKTRDARLVVGSQPAFVLVVGGA